MISTADGAAEDAVNAEPGVEKEHGKSSGDRKSAAEWTEVVHPKYKRPFWYHRASRKSTWTPPPGVDGRVALLASRDVGGEEEEGGEATATKPALEHAASWNAGSSGSSSSRRSLSRREGKDGSSRSESSSKSSRSSTSASKSKTSKSKSSSRRPKSMPAENLLSSSSRHAQRPHDPVIDDYKESKAGAGRLVGQDGKKNVKDHDDGDDVVDDGGWEEHFHKHFNLPYWYNRRERRSTWTPPETQKILRGLALDDASGAGMGTGAVKEEKVSKRTHSRSKRSGPVVDTYDEDEHGAIVSANEAEEEGAEASIRVGTTITIRGTSGPLTLLEGMHGRVVGFVSCRASTGPFVLEVAGKRLVASQRVLRVQSSSAGVRAAKSDVAQKSDVATETDDAKAWHASLRAPNNPFSDGSSERSGTPPLPAGVPRKPHPLVSALDLKAQLQQRELKKVTSEVSEAEVETKMQAPPNGQAPLKFNSADLLAAVQLKKTSLRKTETAPLPSPAAGKPSLLEALKNNVMFRSSQSRLEENPASNRGSNADDDDSSVFSNADNPFE